MFLLLFFVFIEAESDENEFVESCMRFIEQNAESCVKTTGWLELPKDALIKLISSQQVTMPKSILLMVILYTAFMLFKHLYVF